MQDANVIVRLGYPPHRCGGTVRGVVVDKDYFVVSACEHLLQALTQGLHVRALIESGKHDCQFVGYAIAFSCRSAHIWPKFNPFRMGLPDQTEMSDEVCVRPLSLIEKSRPLSGQFRAEAE